MYITIKVNGENLKGEYKQNQKDVNFEAYSVDGFYNKPSIAKRDAENEILKKMDKCGGHGYYVTGGNTCTFSAVWFVEIDGEGFQIRETACNTFIEGPKTLTIKNAIEDERAKVRKMKKEREEREQREQAERLRKNLQKAIDRQQVKAFILNLWDELGGIIDDEYKTLYTIFERETKEFVLDNIDDPWSIINDDWLSDEIWKIITQ